MKYLSPYLIVSVVCFAASPALALVENTCASLPSATDYDASATVSHVYDGDTLKLSNGDKIRLIGINTPELGRKDKAVEPFAVAAKNTLKALLKSNQSINLLYGKEKKDHYGRYLAHGFLADGENIQATLLNRGLARTIALPPNTRFSACYLQQELTARCNKVGLWKNTEALQAKKLNKNHAGFQLVEGTVKHIKTDKRGIWLNIDDKVTVGIRPGNQSLFDDKAIKALLNQSIIVRGWLNKSKKSTPYYIRVRHPSSIALSSQFSCN